MTLATSLNVSEEAVAGRRPTTGAAGGAATTRATESHDGTAVDAASATMPFIAPRRVYRTSAMSQNVGTPTRRGVWSDMARTSAEQAHWLNSCHAPPPKHVGHVQIRFGCCQTIAA